jgi:hypothetical protein
MSIAINFLCFCLRCRIEIMGKELVVVDTPNILHSSDFTSFWILWKEKFIQVGKGDVPGHQIFMAFENYYYYPVTSVSVSTGNNSAGKSGIAKITY